MIRPERFIRKAFAVEATRVSKGNMADVAKWCDGRVSLDQESIELKVVKPNYGGFGRAHVGEWILRVHNGFKIYRDKQFREAFKPVRTGAMNFEEVHQILRDAMNKQDTATYFGNPRGVEGVANDATLRILRLFQ